jgi:hypothetical protein
VRSPLLGPAGNVEFFLHLVPQPGRSRPLPWPELLG